MSLTQALAALIVDTLPSADARERPGRDYWIFSPLRYR